MVCVIQILFILAKENIITMKVILIIRALLVGFVMLSFSNSFSAQTQSDISGMSKNGTDLGSSNSVGELSRVEEKYGVSGYSVVFWNIENFFDLMPSTNYVETGFTPKGPMRWSRKRFNKKRDGIAKVLIATGFSDNLPTIISFAEVENRYVLNQLIYETPLYNGNYRIIHKDSPDRRGIDVALFYRKDLFRSLKNRWIPVEFADSQFSRDILYVKGVFQELDTVHLFVNHWPSKYGGEKISAPKRLVAALALGNICDSLLQQNSKSNILVMGDFNDTPDSKVFESLKSLRLLEHNTHLNPKFREQFSGELKMKGIVNLKGTIKYKGVWEKIDHFFVSENILDNAQPISIEQESVLTFGAKYLLEKDRAYIGRKPRRTYIGPRYNGGLSDHLPIVLKIKRNW